jgi:uncharacterized protein (DUF305 family)
MTRFTHTPQNILAGIACLTLLLGGCGLVTTSDYGTPQSDAGSSETSFSAGELMFAQMMIPHHQQAVEMSDLAMANSTNPEILSLAATIKAGQEPEIEQMQGWLDQTPSIRNPGSMDHGGMDHGGMMMGGMATAAQMSELAALRSPQFDDLFLRLMIDHHEGALDMVSMIQGSTNPEVRALAADITRVQKEEIAAMRALLQALLGP